LKGRLPLATHRTAWANGALPLEISAYAGADELPGELVTSVRCIVVVGDRLILCSNEDGVHPWPGGRREGAESYLDTAVREVHEETGWRLDRPSFQRLGWLHLRHLGACPPDYPYPYPDFLQLVFAATARQSDADSPAGWKDLDGHEQSSALVGIAEALQRTAKDPLASAFLRLLPGSQR
jgi:ADP-ribose pyrophosphatase YjhB (NUDIX family)